MEESIKIPKERIAALIGSSGNTKKQIEKLTNTRLIIESNTGMVEIQGKEKGLEFYNAMSIVKAIARGFAPEKALLLADPEYYLDIIDIRETVESSKALEIKKGRIIGRKGKARENIEKATGCFVSVYGKTVAIIGKAEEIENARKAVEMLLDGAKHTTAIGFLKKAEATSRKFEL